MSEIATDSLVLSPSSVVAACKEQVSSALGDEVVILNLKTGVYHGVDGVAALIWKLLDQPISLTSICEAVQQEYDVAADICQHDVIRLVGEFAAQGLVEVVHATPR